MATTVVGRASARQPASGERVATRCGGLKPALRSTVFCFSLVAAGCGDASDERVEIVKADDMYFDEALTDAPPELTRAVSDTVSLYSRAGPSETAWACDAFTYRRHRVKESAFLVACPSGVSHVVEGGRVTSTMFVTTTGP